MKSLVVLAVLGVCSASTWQATYGGYGVYGAPYQRKWTGPVAATVPAGVDGTITPVSDTYEVAAARNAFFQAYNAQLAAVGAYRYGTPAYHHATPAVHVSVAAPATHHSALTYGAAPVPVGDTPAVAAAKADFFRLYNLQAAAAAAAPDHDAPRYYYTIADSECSISSSADSGSSHAYQSRPNVGPINTVQEAGGMQCDSRQVKQDIMKSLVILAVLGVCSASTWQATYGGYGVYGAPYQRKWTGPVAATVPAGVDGTITPVSDTYEVATARNAFFKAYNAQLAAVGAYRYGTPAYHHATPAVHVSVAAPAAHHSALTYGAAPVPVGDTAAVAAAKADFFRLYNLQAAAAAAAPDHDAPRYYY
ncbi:uncharacterized protein LOC119593570 [Penaeus monodon]|uniref:uncharacterized protein LOC119593570 n=1 Tax=Penaeus monodon TaxID=6687 RepID=UPI0018A78D10|nr:uncharacterized protein LOC119593570 [Penaeus monodon]